MLFQDQIYYPIINTCLFDKTVKFYQDFFDFRVLHREDGFHVMEREGKIKQYLGIVENGYDFSENGDSSQATNHGQSTGSMMNFYVENIGLALQQLEWQGAMIIGDITKAKCGRKFFAIKDPNGIIITIAEKDGKINYIRDENLSHLERYIA